MGDTPQALGRTDTGMESIPCAAPETAKPGGGRGWLPRGWGLNRGASSARRRSVNRHRGQFSLLVVRGDGVRVVRFNFARPLAVAGFVAIAASMTTVGVLTRDWFQLRQLTRDAVTFAAQIEDQRKTINDFKRRVPELRKAKGAGREIDTR